MKLQQCSKCAEIRLVGFQKTTRWLPLRVLGNLKRANPDLPVEETICEVCLARRTNIVFNGKGGCLSN